MSSHSHDHPLLQDLEKVLFSEDAIQRRLALLGAEITGDYQGKELTVVAVLHGGIVFLADLLRRIHLPLMVETINVASYHGGLHSSGNVQFKQVNLPDLRGKHILLLDDILDTGRTLDAIGQRIGEECLPESVKNCVFLEKQIPRSIEVQADYVGFEIADEFVVGYGLDYQGRYRNLPLVGTLRKDLVTHTMEGERN